MTQLFQPKYRVHECLDALQEVLTSGWTGTGPKCAEFEKTWSSFIQARHSLFLNSATAALHIALRLANLPAGSKVATTPITFVSTNAVILYEKLQPVFCDVEHETHTLSFESVAKAIGEGARAVIWVHYGGTVSDEFYKLMDFVRGQRGNRVHVIEDCAHAAGAFYKDGSRVGSRTDTISCFSFQAVKNLPTFDSGMICVRSDEELARARRLSWLGIDKSTFHRTGAESNEVYKWQYDVPELGWKYNGNDIAAATALVQLRYLDHDNAYRKRLAAWYEEDITAQVGYLEHADGSSHHLVVYRSGARDKLIAQLKLNGIAPGVHYLPNYKFKPFEEFYRKDCPNAEVLGDVSISLPNHLGLTREDVRKISGVVNSCFP